MDKFPYLLAAFLIIWIVVFAYVVGMYKKQQQIRHDIDLLKQELDEKTEAR